MTALDKKLTQLLERSELSVNEEQKSQLLKFVALLHKWNKAYNLTSVREPSEMLIKHIIDSLVVAPYLDGKNFIDVGTGPGLPGLPLAIINPEKSFTLLDSLGKRIRFIRQVVHELQLTNVYPVQSRVEDFQPETGFDGVLSRAFASARDMLEWCHHLPHNKGCFLALKGQLDSQELDLLPKDDYLIEIKPLLVAGLTGQRHLLILKKRNIEKLHV
ncbi:MAG: 16S rRNA (guanine(527)-N(7))-methyltransferase RsmG [Vibrionaceae bacterium]